MNIQNYVKNFSRDLADEYIREEAWRSLSKGYWLSVIVLNEYGEPYVCLITDSIDLVMEEVWGCVGDGQEVFVQGVKVEPSGELYWNTTFRDGQVSLYHVSAEKIDTYFAVSLREEGWKASASNLSDGWMWDEDLGTFDHVSEAKRACERYYVDQFEKVANPEEFQ